MDSWEVPANLSLIRIPDFNFQRSDALKQLWVHISNNSFYWHKRNQSSSKGAKDWKEIHTDLLLKCLRTMPGQTDPCNFHMNFNILSSDFVGFWYYLQGPQRLCSLAPLIEYSGSCKVDQPWHQGRLPLPHILLQHKITCRPSWRWRLWNLYYLVLPLAPNK